MVDQASRPFTILEGILFSIAIACVVMFVAQGLINDHYNRKTDERLKRLEKINGIDEIGRRR